MKRYQYDLSASAELTTPAARQKVRYASFLTVVCLDSARNSDSLIMSKVVSSEIEDNTSSNVSIFFISLI